MDISSSSQILDIYIYCRPNMYLFCLPPCMWVVNQSGGHQNHLGTRDTWALGTRGHLVNWALGTCGHLVNWGQLDTKTIWVLGTFGHLDQWALAFLHRMLLCCW